MKAALKILAVDDNPSIRQSMPYIFAGPRYEVSTEPDCDHALARLNAHPAGYDVIIVDERMPQGTGVELVQGIRERGITGEIIILSAHLSSEIREAYEEMDVHMVLDKPFNIEELRLAVDRLAA